MDPVLATDIERALRAHARHIVDGPLKEAWTAAPERLRDATSQADIDALYTDLRAAGRWESSSITAGGALAVLNGLLTRVKLSTGTPEEPEEAP